MLVHIHIYTIISIPYICTTHFLYRLDTYGHHVLKVNIYTGLGKARSPCLGTPPHPLLFGRLMDAHNEKLEIISSLLKESGILPCLLSVSLSHIHICVHTCTLTEDKC